MMPIDLLRRSDVVVYANMLSIAENHSDYECDSYIVANL